MLHRRVAYYSILTSFVADAYASKAETLNHLTLWSWFLQLLYFELPLPDRHHNNNNNNNASIAMIKALHGPAFTGAHALFGMYLWTLYANPSMEFDLAPTGRAAWLVLARAAWMHATPVLFQWIDLLVARRVLQQYVYLPDNNNNNKKKKENGEWPPTKWAQRALWFWMAVGGYFAMGLTWEQVNGDATGTYHITNMSAETYVAISKVVGVASCIGSFWVGLRPLLMEGDSRGDENNVAAADKSKAM